MRWLLFPLLRATRQILRSQPSVELSHFAAMESVGAKVAPVVRKDGSHLVECNVGEYDALLSAKVDTLKTLLKWDKNVDVFESARTNFRMRANFQMWHDDPRNKTPNGFYYSMFEQGVGKDPYEVKSFPRGTLLINKLMDDFMKVFKERKIIFQNLFEVRFVTTQTQQAVVVLLYKQPLASNWLAEAEEVSKQLNVKIVGRARKMIQVTGGDETIVETYHVKGKPFSIYQTEGAFSQPNAGVCEKMITWAMDRTEGSSNEDLLELYCGGGTFTAPMARNFRRVLATEISKASVNLAHKTFALNGIENIKIARLSSEEFSEAYSSRKPFQRLVEGGIDLTSYDISTVLVDPPRAGLDPGTCKLISQFPKIVYISCNPETLARDVQMLSETHDLVRVAAFDQFPYTHHLEGGAFLVRRSAPAAAQATAAEDSAVGSKRELDGAEGAEDKKSRL